MASNTGLRLFPCIIAIVIPEIGVSSICGSIITGCPLRKIHSLLSSKLVEIMR
jgi:hypothetical protein